MLKIKITVKKNRLTITIISIVGSPLLGHFWIRYQMTGIVPVECRRMENPCNNRCHSYADEPCFGPCIPKSVKAFSERSIFRSGDICVPSSRIWHGEMHYYRAVKPSLTFTKTSSKDPCKLYRKLSAHRHSLFDRVESARLFDSALAVVTVNNGLDSTDVLFKTKWTINSNAFNSKRIIITSLVFQEFLLICLQKVSLT